MWYIYTHIHVYNTFESLVWSQVMPGKFFPFLAAKESGEFKPITPISSDKNRFVRGISDQTDQSHDATFLQQKQNKHRDPVVTTWGKKT